MHCDLTCFIAPIAYLLVVFCPCRESDDCQELSLDEDEGEELLEQEMVEVQEVEMDATIADEDLRTEMTTEGCPARAVGIDSLAMYR